MGTIALVICLLVGIYGFLTSPVDKTVDMVVGMKSRVCGLATKCKEKFAVCKEKFASRSKEWKEGFSKAKAKVKATDEDGKPLN